MHLIGTDLYFKRLPVRTDDRGVQRLIHIGFRHGDVIFKSARNRLIHLMDHAKRRIAVFYACHNDPDGKQIVDLVYRLVLIFHFLVNTEEMFYTAVNFRPDPCIFDMFPDFFYDGLDILFPDALSDRYFVHQIIVYFRFQIF